MPEHTCGPSEHGALFAAVQHEIRSAGLTDQYAIGCIDHEMETLGIDFATRCGLSRFADGTITTTFVSRSDAPSDSVGYKWLGSECIYFWALNDQRARSKRGLEGT